MSPATSSTAQGTASAEKRRPGSGPGPERTRAEDRPRADRSGRSTLPVDALDDRGDPLAHPDAHRDQAVAAAGPPELVDEHRHQARSAHPERMAQRDGTPVDVDDRRVQAQLVDAHERLRCEGLVELDEIEIAGGDAGPHECLATGRDGADA